MKPMTFLRLTAAAAFATGLAASAQAADISGAGATFPYPVYAKWADSYKKETGNGVNYQSIGSGGGVKQIKARTVTFGATDAPLKGKELDEAGLTQWPMVMGGIVPVINVEGVRSGDITLDGPTLANIFLGAVKTWDDAAIARLNPGVKLPAMPIAVVHRSDGSGTTFNCGPTTSSKVSPEWKAKAGEGTAVEWPAGVGAKGNEGVAGNVAQTKNAHRLCRIRLRQAEQADLHRPRQRRRQRRSQPTVAAFQAAAANADWSKEPGYYADPDRPAGRRLLADHRRDLHPHAETAQGCRRRGRGAEILQLVLRQWREERRRPRLHPHAG
jgi:phosphate transport system substrate-binding protein